MLFFILCASISLALATPVHNVYSLEDFQELFETFIKDYNKQYEGNEKEKRLQIFLDNLNEINLLNEKSSNAVYGITKFTDLTKDEFIQTYTGFKADKNVINRKYEAEVLEQFNYTAPSEFDWRSKGVVSRVKNQGHCGSCWAFSVTGNVESINAIKTGSIVEISEQQLVDCDEKSDGCSGGDTVAAMNYLVQNGAMSWESYPYDAKDGSCHFNSRKVVIHLKKYLHLRTPEKNITEILFKTGPLSIAIDAMPLSGYNGGILVENCRNVNDINHSVLLVGYGQEKGVDYWIVKNSWSESWGEKGYFRMKRGVNCLNIQLYESCVYFTDSEDDAIGRFIKRAIKATPYVIIEYNIKMAIKDRNSAVVEALLEMIQKIKTL